MEIRQCRHFSIIYIKSFNFIRYNNIMTRFTLGDRPECTVRRVILFTSIKKRFFYLKTLLTFTLFMLWFVTNLIKQMIVTQILKHKFSTKKIKHKLSKRKIYTLCHMKLYEIICFRYLETAGVEPTVS